MENLSAVSYASTGICGCGQVRAKRLKQAFSFFSLPKFSLWIFWRGGDAKPWYFTALEATPPPNLVCGIFEGGDAKPWYFTALEATPPHKFHCRSRIPFLSIFKNKEQEFAEVIRGLFFWSMYIHFIYPDISRIMVGIRRTPPPRLLEAQKIRGGGIFHMVRWNMVEYFSEISGLTPPKKIFQG